MKRKRFAPPVEEEHVRGRDVLGRREFLEKQLKGAAILAAAAATIHVPKSVFAMDIMDIPDLGIAKGQPGPATRAAVDLLGGMKAFVKPGNKVVIKPNMSFEGGPETAVNTHPEVVREIAAMCKEAGASRVRVLDHPFEPTRLGGIKIVQEACGVIGEGIVHGLFDPDLYRPVEIGGAMSFKKTDVMMDVLEADVLIAAPVAKAHMCTGVSLSMKGMMGLIWNRQAMHRDHSLDPALVDLCSLLRPQLVVVDATRVLSTGGPHGPGRVIRMGTVIASRDMVAADAKTVEMCEWFGRRFEPRRIKHIKLAHERGLGRMDVENLTVKVREL
jgi:uncharacterized protein (DUF362 family)